jgi:hypothetical protein
MKPPRRQLTTLSRRSVTADVPTDDDEPVDCVFLQLAASLKKRCSYQSKTGLSKVLSELRKCSPKSIPALSK